MNRFEFLRAMTWLLAAVIAVLLPACASAAEAGEFKLRAQLIWGTNDEKPKDGQCKDVETALRDKLQRVFKWKNYFEVKKQDFSLRGNDSKRVKLSDKCELEGRIVDDFTVEFKLFGEDKLTKTLRVSIQALKQGELAVLAGDSKEKYGDAWFVVVSMPKG